MTATQIKRAPGDDRSPMVKRVNTMFRLSRGDDHRTKQLKPITTTWEAFVRRMSEPRIGVKAGTYITRGLVHGDRADENMPHAVLVVFDGDASMDPKTGELLDGGAPRPELAAQALHRAGLRYLVVTTWSHGTEGKGNRWRVFMPADRPYTQSECEAVTLAAHLLLTQGGCAVAYSPESARFSQPWFMARKPDERAESVAIAGNGALFNVDAALEWWQARQDAQARTRAAAAKRQARTVEFSGPSQIEVYNEATDIGRDLLEPLGYELKATGTENGRPLARYLCPESTTGEPGTIVFYRQSDGRQVVFSHGTSCPLADGRAHDAWDAAAILGVRQ